MKHEQCALASQYLFRDANSGDDLKQCLPHTLCRNCVQHHCSGWSAIRHGLGTAQVHQGLPYTALEPYWYTVHPSQTEGGCWRASNTKHLLHLEQHAAGRRARVAHTSNTAASTLVRLTVSEVWCL